LFIWAYYFDYYIIFLYIITAPFFVLRLSL